MEYGEDRELTVGSVKLRVTLEIDYYPDASWLGTFSEYREPENEDEKLVYLKDMVVLDHHGIWRDEYGRIVPTPEPYEYSRDYQYTFHNNGHDKIAYAIQDAKRLRDLNNGRWAFLVCVATVTMDGRQIGNWALGGLEDDCDKASLDSEMRVVAREAVADAKAWRSRNLITT